MKILSWLLTLPVLLACVFFAVSNRQDVTVDLWPFDYVLSTPLYVATLGAFFAGLLCGALWFWLINLRHRWDKHRLTKEVDKLKTKLDEEKAKTPAVTTP